MALEENEKEEEGMQEEAHSQYKVDRLKRIQENDSGIRQVTSDMGAWVKCRDIETERKGKIELKKLRTYYFVYYFILRKAAGFKILLWEVWLFD